MNRDDYTIVATYGAEYRGIVQYYLLAGDVFRLEPAALGHGDLDAQDPGRQAPIHGVEDGRPVHRATIDTPHGLRACFEARVERAGRQPLVARFGGIPLERQRGRGPHRPHPRPGHPTRARSWSPGSCNGRCELCEQPGKVRRPPRPRPRRPRPSPAQASPSGRVLMASKRRKTLVVCRPCHDAIHSRRPAASRRDHWRAGCPETGPSGSAGGRTEKDLPSGHLAARPTQFVRDIDTRSRSVVRHLSPARIGVSASPRRPIALPGPPVRACWQRRCVLPEHRRAWTRQPRWLSARPP